MIYIFMALGIFILKFLCTSAITDTAVQAAMADIFAPSAVTTTPYNIMMISTEVGSTTTTASFTASQAGVTSIPIAAAPFAIPAGNVYLDYVSGNGANGPNPQEYLTTSGCIAGATSLPVTSFTTLYAHASGVSVVPVALVTDNPSAAPAGAQYQTLTSGAYGAISGTGVGNRTRVITATFAGASTTAATYTAIRLVNANPVVSGSTGATSYIPKAVIDSTHNGTFQITVKW